MIFFRQCHMFLFVTQSKPTHSWRCRVHCPETPEHRRAPSEIFRKHVKQHVKVCAHVRGTMYLLESKQQCTAFSWRHDRIFLILTSGAKWLTSSGWRRKPMYRAMWSDRREKADHVFRGHYYVRRGEVKTWWFALCSSVKFPTFLEPFMIKICDHPV